MSGPVVLTCGLCPNSTYIEGPAELVVTNKPSGDQSVLAVDYVSFRYNAP